uniref:MULE transposase domain-containing protein n=1 Tax=Lactuca sativa TaxID=4236 RepID=A0A9R1W338_LACSA|nr:hypothetical protein LSAT_V11C300145960 [Lactuca sativa]
MTIQATTSKRKSKELKTQKTYRVGISMEKVFREKDKVRKHVTRDYTKQYELLRDYVLELQATNPDTTIKKDECSEPKLDSPTRQFRRIYVCLDPLKKGFKACLRDFLGFDGAFMKGPFPAQVLSIIGLDSNNGIYPLAYGIKWFLQNLGDDLDLRRNSNFTFISDRQKVFPNAEHRYYIRHIHDNMRKKWRQIEYRDHLWRCASATIIHEFEHLMKEFVQYNKEVCEWLKQILHVHWAMSHFSVSDVLISNMCEVFNGKIDKGRDKPVIGCLKYIREYLMKRICNVMKEMKMAKGGMGETSIKSQELCRINMWWIHAIATLNEMSKDPEAKLNIYKWVHKVYFLETWKKAYSFKVEPIKGRSMWPKSECPTKLIPPPHRTQRESQRDGVNATQEGGSQKPTNDGVQKLSRKHISVTITNARTRDTTIGIVKGKVGISPRSNVSCMGFSMILVAFKNMGVMFTLFC